MLLYQTLPCIWESCPIVHIINTLMFRTSGEQIDYGVLVYNQQSPEGGPDLTSSPDCSCLSRVE